MTRQAMIVISGNAIKNAIVDLRRANLCSVSCLLRREREDHGLRRLPSLNSFSDAGRAAAVVTNSDSEL